jgi:hypothetical protein
MTAPGNPATPSPGAIAPRSLAATRSDRPRPISAADHEAFEALVKEALPAVRSMAAAWRTGLTALITLVTTGIVVTGRTSATTLTVPWRAAVTLTIGGGLALAIAALWHSLAAEAGARTQMLTLDAIRAQHASVQAYQAGQAAAAGRRLHTARTMAVGALSLLLTGVLLTWWAPAAPATPSAMLKVTGPGGTTCGMLQSADRGTLRLAVAGVHEPVAIPLTAVTNLATTATCP